MSVGFASSGKPYSAKCGDGWHAVVPFGNKIFRLYLKISKMSAGAIDIKCATVGVFPCNIELIILTFVSRRLRKAKELMPFKYQ